MESSYLQCKVAGKKEMTPAHELVSLSKVFKVKNKGTITKHLLHFNVILAFGFTLYFARKIFYQYLKSTLCVLVGFRQIQWECCRITQTLLDCKLSLILQTDRKFRFKHFLNVFEIPQKMKTSQKPTQFVGNKAKG